MKIYEFQKNALEKVRVEISSYRGKDVVNIRVYYLADIAKDDWRPSPKGLTMRTGLIPELKKAIDKAHDRFQEDQKNKTRIV